MNTRYTRVVVALLLAVASLATVGFRAPHEDSRSASIVPDHITCELIDPSLAAIDLLDLADGSCYPDLIDRIEFEIGRTLAGAAPSLSLLERFSALGRFSDGGSIEYLEIMEAEAASVNTSPRAFTAPAESPVALSGPSAVDVPLDNVYTNASARDIAALNEPRAETNPRVGFDGPSATDVPLDSVYTHVRSADPDKVASVPFIDYHNPSSPEADVERVTRARTVSAPSEPRYEGFIDYHNPSSPWADSDQIGGTPAAFKPTDPWSQAFIDYHNPSSPWADSDQIGGTPAAFKPADPWSQAFIDYHNPSSPWADSK